MKVLRIKLTQNKAHYRKEESDKNKMTYPLPPFSTVIGAIHNACNFKEYHPMDLSIQGRYHSMAKQPYTDYCFLDSVMDDRGILVKAKNSILYSTAFEKVGKAMKGTGNSFRKDITVQIYNKELMNEYRELKNLNDEMGSFKKLRLDKMKKIFKKRKAILKSKKKSLDKKSEGFENLTLREKEIVTKEKYIDSKYKEYLYENYTKEISKYQSLTTSLKYYEILNEVELILHIKTDDVTLKLIEENIYNLKSIGRSEDFVDVEECKVVEVDEISKKSKSSYSSYIGYNLIKNRDIIFSDSRDGISAKGTKYYINKSYEIKNGARVFEKIKVIYTSNFRVHKKSKSVYMDEEYIVNFN